MNSPLNNTLTIMLMQTPVLLVFATGFFVAIVRWKDTPIPSLILVILMPMWGLLKIGMVAAYSFVPRMAENGSLGLDQISLVYRGMNCGASMLEALAIAALLCAVFAPRPTANQLPTKP